MWFGYYYNPMQVDLSWLLCQKHPLPVTKVMNNPKNPKVKCGKAGCTDTAKLHYGRDNRPLGLSNICRICEAVYDSD